MGFVCCKSVHKEKMVLRQSYLYYWNTIPGKPSLYWNGSRRCIILCHFAQALYHCSRHFNQCLATAERPPIMWQFCEFGVKLGSVFLKHQQLYENNDGSLSDFRLECLCHSTLTMTLMQFNLFVADGWVVDLQQVTTISHSARLSHIYIYHSCKDTAYLVITVSKMFMQVLLVISVSRDLLDWRNEINIATVGMVDYVIDLKKMTAWW